MKNEAKSQTDDRQTAYFDSNSNENGVGIHIPASTINVTAIDNAMEMPKPNDAVDYSTFEMSRNSDDALAVETGEQNL